MQSKFIFKWLLLGLLGLQQLQEASSARILAVFFFPARSHFVMTSAIIRELVKRGHEVTFVTAFSLAKENLGGNYTEVLIPQYNFWPDLMPLAKIESVFDMTDMPKTTFFKVGNIMGVRSTEFALEQPKVQELINAPNKTGKYDLLIAEQFYNEPQLLFSKLYQIPVITASTFGYANYMGSLVGTINPWSYVPHAALPLTDHMNFVQRINNVYVNLLDELYRHFQYYPAQNALIQKYFSNVLDEVPTVQQLERNISVILLNNYVPLVTARPTAFNMIHVGGLHIKPPKPLPSKLKQFLDEAQHGAIYFSLGTQVRSADLPPEKLKIFLNVFAGLKQRVLWKFEEENIANLPANVMIQKWMPQGDILAHPNVKLFITHGGLFGTQEAVHYGVPMLGFPVYYDQHLNINKGKEAGYTLGLDYRSLTEENLKSSLLDLLENPKYRKNMARASRIFRDRPLSAMDNAMFWIDYVIEHKGATHLMAAGAKLTWYQFYLLDIIGLSLAILLLPVLVFYILLRRSTTKKSKSNSKSKVKRN